MELIGIMLDVTGNGKSKMAAYKLVVSIYMLADEIEGQCQRVIIPLLDLEIVGLVVEILFLSHLEPEILVFSDCRPPFHCWTSDISFRCPVLP